MKQFPYLIKAQNCCRKLTGINRKRPGGFRIWLIVFILLLTSCTTAPHKRNSLSFSPSRYLRIDAFCTRNNLRYSFNTIDDIISIFSPKEDIRLLLNSNVAYFNGRVIYLNRPPFYSKGQILIPKELEKVISSGEDITLLPVFTINKIVIDPGHGGRDPGAVSPRGLQEKTLNLKVSKYLKEELQKRGFKVFLTRSRDTYLTLKERVEVAKKYNADIFLSIHSNSNRANYIKGIEIYYLSPYDFNPSQRAVKLARSNDFEGLSHSVKAIIWDLLLTKNYAISMQTAHSLYFAFRNLGFKVSHAKKANFYVLRLAYVPSILVEIGYLTNRAEESILRKSYYQKQIAEAIALGIVSLKKRYIKFAKDAN